jgi:hypothetical protein
MPLDAGSQLARTVINPQPPATTTGTVTHEKLVVALSSWTDQLIRAQPASVHHSRSDHLTTDP